MLIPSAVACSDDHNATPPGSLDPQSTSGVGSASPAAGATGAGAIGAGATGAAPTQTGGTEPTEPEPTEPTGGDGTGTGGAPSAGGSFGSAGTPDSGSSSVPETPAAAGEATGGAPGPGGSSEQGPGGAAGQPAAAPLAEACVECGARTCGAQLDACANSPECSGWLACFSACADDACAQACDATFARVARVYYDIYACLCGSCETDCKVAPVCGRRCKDDQALAPTTVAPATLADTGLYAAASSPTALPAVASNVEPYTPNYALWADGAGKDRYIYVPACATIDTRDADHWQFPVGTRLWKHFSLGANLLETRMMHRYGSGADDWLFATYGWDPAKPHDASAAVAVLHGQPNTAGTMHDIPDPWECGACHGKQPDKPLGFSAIQLSHGGAGLTMQKLSDWGWLTVPARDGFIVPGTPVQRAALGYLHANCGGCHNSRGQLPRDNPMLLRLLVAQTDYAKTDTVITTVGVPTTHPSGALHGKPRIDPQQPTSSALFLRMSNRGEFPMPPIATQLPDTDGGLAVVHAWIDSIPKP
jgi:hypothetical protein